METNRFQKVLVKAKRWETEVNQHLTKRGWIVVPMGTENLLPKVQKAIINMKDPDETANFIKYLPDGCLLYTSPSPRDRQKSRMPSSA